ncbi:hypothetical protein JHK82_024734 [Glycine max]|uniref:18 kDa seed maturation protein n=1 Tax=Glycine soja TaxID=3848 RepID=A0A445IZS3_GLYSO|nr:18 kDa seed maturation protein-like [Glycine soja]KAG5006794.1 hypothetical protein JHK85_025336 [Glycine max]KAG5133546.1 hypothetical protein JHK82_024734 [Glycine max]RZB91599.1 18 kDa seed maturation protein [Glycine soja]
MQAAKKAIETFKETAANIGASAKSGLEKTKATIQEKNEKMNAEDQTQMDMATKRKEEKINQAEMEKQQARKYYAAAKQYAMAEHMAKGNHDTAGPRIETATHITSGPGTDNAMYSNTGPGTETATYTTSGLGHDNAIPTSTGPGTATYTTRPGHDNAIPIRTGPGPETATYPTGDYGQMGANQGHEHGPRQGGLTEDVTAQNTLVAGGSAPSSGPGPTLN